MFITLSEIANLLVMTAVLTNKTEPRRYSTVSWRWQISKWYLLNSVKNLMKQFTGKIRKIRKSKYRFINSLFWWSCMLCSCSVIDSKESCPRNAALSFWNDVSMKRKSWKPLSTVTVTSVFRLLHWDSY